MPEPTPQPSFFGIEWKLWRCRHCKRVMGHTTLYALRLITCQIDPLHNELTINSLDISTPHKVTCGWCGAVRVWAPGAQVGTYRYQKGAK